MGDDGEDAAPETLTVLAAQAAVHHEIFTAYITAGFTRGEALHILTSIIVASLGTQQP